MLPDAARPPTMLDRQINGPKAWSNGTIQSGEWLVPLTAAALSELRTAVDRLRRAPLPLLLVGPDQFALDACRNAMRAAKTKLDDGMGVALVDRLPMDEWSIDEALIAYWLLGQLLGRAVATKWDGTMLYHVQDTGKQFGYGVRGSATNVELSFHTDNAFGATLPDYVGLLCIRPAADGGVSRFCSLYTVHNRMLAVAPGLLRRLYEPAFYDRQAEHARDAPKTLLAPMFSFDGQRLRARVVPGLIRSGYQIAGRAMDSELSDALDCLAELLAAEDLHIEFTIKRGQLQYLNNLEFAHYRSAFADHSNPLRKRHLVRVWHRDAGAQSYDG